MVLDRFVITKPKTFYCIGGPRSDEILNCNEVDTAIYTPLTQLSDIPYYILGKDNELVDCVSDTVIERRLLNALVTLSKVCRTSMSSLFCEYQKDVDGKHPFT